jgi:predicted nucleic acid-binding protein
VIVVDTNVLAYLLLPYESSAQADALYKRDPAWAAPIFWRSEFRNLLAGYLRRKTLTFDEALKVQAEAEALLAGNEHEVDSRRVLELARDSDCTAYDCEFVALAMQLGVKVVTIGQKGVESLSSARGRTFCGMTCELLRGRSMTGFGVIPRQARLLLPPRPGC